MKPDPMLQRDLIGYGERPPHPQWPNGARIAVNFNLNHEGGGESTLANGDAVSEGMLNDIGVPAKTGMREPLVESVFEYGSRVGAWRVLRAFDDFEVKISVLGVVRALEQNPVVTEAFGAGMAGLAGAFLSVAYLDSWAEGMTAGRGWVALALVIFAGWHPIKLLGGAYLFGFAYIMIAESQVLGGVFFLISTYVMQMFPFVMAILVLAVMGRRAMKHRIGAPEALALPYVREER